jgi:hypothetical protein
LDLDLQITLKLVIMKKKCLLLLLLFCCLSCQKYEELVNELSLTPPLTKACYSGIKSFIGEQNPYIGDVYTYNVVLPDSLSEPTVVKAYSSSASSATIQDATGCYSASSSIALKKGLTKFSFKVLWINDAKNSDVSVNTDASCKKQISGCVSEINTLRKVITITAPKNVALGDEFDICASFHSLNKNCEGVWTFDRSTFKEDYRDIDTLNNKLILRLKSLKVNSNSNVKLEIRGKYKILNGDKQYKLSDAEHFINVIDPFVITSSKEFVSQGDTITFKMDNLGLVPNAKVTWCTTTNGLTLNSGQNTSRAVYIASHTYKGFSTVTATNANGTVTSKRVWIGTPIIKDDGIYKNLVIQRRDRGVTICQTFEGYSSIVWKKMSGNASPNELKSSNCITVMSLAPESSTDVIKVAAEASNPCGTTIKTFDISVIEAREILIDDYTVGNPIVSGTSLDYPITFKSSKSFDISSLYAMCLYKGVYDGDLASKDWNWQGKLPPAIDAKYGNIVKLVDVIYDGGITRNIQAGTSFTYEVHHTILPGKTINDIEYVILYIYDSNKRRYVDLRDFLL